MRLLRRPNGLSLHASRTYRRSSLETQQQRLKVSPTLSKPAFKPRNDETGRDGDWRLGARCLPDLREREPRKPRDHRCNRPSPPIWIALANRVASGMLGSICPVLRYFHLVRRKAAGVSSCAAATRRSSTVPLAEVWLGPGTNRVIEACAWLIRSRRRSSPSRPASSP